MRPAIPFLLVVGILLGPVYYAYCLLFSGKSVQTVNMTERASRWVTPDGSILRFANGMAYRPIALTLRPDMNRIAFRVKFTFAEPRSARTAPELQLRYQATLVQLDHTVLERPMILSVKRAGTQTIDVGPLEISYPAEYLFLLEEAGDPDLAPVVSLELIEKIETPVMSIVWTGLVLLVIAAILTIRDAYQGVRRSRSH